MMLVLDGLSKKIGILNIFFGLSRKKIVKSVHNSRMKCYN